VLRDGAAGIFLAANTFPKSRETRAPLVEELYRFRDRLPEKLRYLADAPQTDPDGNKSMVRFSRKTKQQYVAAEKDGKATGWSAFFVDGKWVEGRNNSVSAEFLLKGSRKRPFCFSHIIFCHTYTAYI
jgi:DNA topoisomerase-1